MNILLATIAVLCIGDSFTIWPANYCDTSAHDTTNVGIGGTTVAGWDGAFPFWAAPHVAGQDVVSILLGANSALSFPVPVPAATWGASMRSLVDKMPDSDIVISMQPHALGFNPAYNGAIDGYRAQAIAIASERSHVRFGVDWQNLGLVPADYDDVIHVGASGHVKARLATDEVLGPVDVPVPEPGTGILLALGLVLSALLIQPVELQ